LWWQGVGHAEHFPTILISLLLVIVVQKDGQVH